MMAEEDVKKFIDAPFINPKTWNMERGTRNKLPSIALSLINLEHGTRNSELGTRISRGKPRKTQEKIF
jgi:hypothetical protein